ncbi:MAG: sugar-binding domain-containing protein [Eubacteriales bacterium]|nr:sugar-binding domain-containing protein [Eubacteriales bacterium]
MNVKEMMQLSMMTEIATMYYEKNMTQSEIGEKLYLSRTRISRILKKAQETGVVEIKINHLLERNYSFEERFKQRFHLKEVILYGGSQGSEEEVKTGVAALAAKYLKQSIKPKMTIGISWGKTVRKAVDAMSDVEKMPVNIVQIMGAASTGNSLNNGDNIANRLAAAYGGTVHNLNTPLFVPDLYVKKQLMKDPLILKSLSLAANADLILTGIGTLDTITDSNPWLGYLTKEMRDEIEAQGAVGCLGARFFDCDGKVLDNSWNNRCVGIELKDLRKVKEVVVVAADEYKAKALLGAIRGGFVDVLITDSGTAQKILEL